MNKRAQPNRLDFTSQLKIVEFLKKGEPWVDTTHEEIARMAESSLQFPINAHNIRFIIKSADIQTKRTSPEDEIMKTLAGSIYGLYMGMPISPKFLELCKALGVV